MHYPDLLREEIRLVLQLIQSLVVLKILIEVNSLIGEDTQAKNLAEDGVVLEDNAVLKLVKKIAISQEIWDNKLKLKEDFQ